MAELCSSKKSWWNKPKIKSPLGTYADHPFHASLCTNDELNADTLPVELYSDVLPYYCLPMCGVYGTDDYHLTDPLVILLLPSLPLLQKMESLFSSHLISAIRDHVRNEKFQAGIIIHSLPNMECGVDPDSKVINIMYHTWAFKGMEDRLVESDPQLTVLAGAFSPLGVTETAQNFVDELNGLTINRLAPKIQYMHDGFSLSPHNAQLLLNDSQLLHSFYSFASHPINGQTILTYHIIPSTEGAEEHITNALSKSGTVGELVQELGCLSSEGSLPDLTEPLSIIRNLLDCID